MTPLTPDPELISACLSGDSRSWDLLILRYEKFIYTLAIRMGMSEPDADDIFQNVCLRLYQNLSSVRDQGRLAAWLAVTTRREVWRLLKSRRSPLEGEMPEESWELEGALPIQAQPEATMEQQLMQMEDQYLMRRCMEQLPQECRKLLLLLYGQEEGCSYSDVAKQMAIPMGSIGPRRARCLGRLKKIFEKLDQ